MTTNGYLLTSDRAHELYGLAIKQYQITLDGPQPQHDHNRPLVNGAGTYQTIIRNLVSLHESDLNIHVTLRTNFDAENASYLSLLVDELYGELYQDPRFRFSPFAVGKWGGANDDGLPVLNQVDAVCHMLNASDYAIEHGMLTSIHEQLEPDQVCYAAMPNSLIIGSDGAVYKCSVAFDNPTHHVGRLFADGHIVMDRDKFALWVQSDGATDTCCQSCRVYPICHGATCPLVRIEANQRPCPPINSNLEGFIRLMALEARA